MVLKKEDVEGHQMDFNTVEIDIDNLSDDRSTFHEQIFSDDFIDKYTLRLSSFEEFISESPADLDDESSFRKDDFEEFVKNNTFFDSWEEMKKKASEEWIASEVNI